MFSNFVNYLLFKTDLSHAPANAIVEASDHFSNLPLGIVALSSFQERV